MRELIIIIRKIRINKRREEEEHKKQIDRQSSISSLLINKI